MIRHYSSFAKVTDNFLPDEECMWLHLSPETTEWLFVVGFWSAINDELGTLFNEYDDDLIEPNVVRQIQLGLEQLIRRKGSCSELSRLASFLGEACQAESKVFFQL
jgi:hypothetical protein